MQNGIARVEQGTTFTAYRQIVADELSVPFESITTVVAGHTDQTPDGSGAFDFLGRGMPNIRKAAAYAYQALLDLASERLSVPRDQLTAKDGSFPAAANPSLTATSSKISSSNSPSPSAGI